MKTILRNISRKQIIAFSAFALITAVFVLLPIPASSLYVRIYFGEISGSACTLYYSTDSAEGFSAEGQVSSEIDYADMKATFRLDGSLAGHITGLRLDFPDAEQLINIKSITVSSAGIVKRQFDPCYFFLDENIAQSNGISSINLVPSRDHAYVATLADDPFLVLSPGLCREITGCFSRFRLTRLLICLFPAACYLVAKAGIFKET